MLCNSDITCRQVSFDYILKRLQMLERLLVGHIICWSVGIMAATVHYLLVGNSHMTNHFQAG